MTKIKVIYTTIFDQKIYVPLNARVYTMLEVAHTKNTEEPNQVLVQRINEGDKTAFRQLFFKYYNDLSLLALQVVGDKKGAEDVVQNVFLNIWNSRQTWHINISLRAYLYRAVKNRAINYAKKQQNNRKKRQNYLKVVKRTTVHSHSATNDKNKSTVEQIWNIVETLPKRRRMVFTLHKKHGLSYKEISNVMDITPKTVENHMGLAIKEVRSQMDDSFS